MTREEKDEFCRICNSMNGCPVVSSYLQDKCHLILYIEGILKRGHGKACEWLEQNLNRYVMDGRDCRPYVSVVLYDDFKKAMSVE